MTLLMNQLVFVAGSTYSLPHCSVQTLTKRYFSSSLILVMPKNLATKPAKCFLCHMMNKNQTKYQKNYRSNQ